MRSSSSSALANCVYTRYLAADPTYNAVPTTLGREVLHNLFPKIAASYVIEFIANPIRYAAWSRDYLARESLRAADADIAAGFQILRPRPPAIRILGLTTPARSRTFAERDRSIPSRSDSSSVSMTLVEPCVRAFGQLSDPPLCIRVRGRRWPPSPVAVSYGRCSINFLLDSKQSPHMALAHSHQPCPILEDSPLL